jgi:hypothetical protein
MTVFGKILVFLNLLFSVVTGALIVFVFTTRSNWVAAYADAKAKAEATEQAYRQEKAAHDNDRKQAEQTLTALAEDKKKADEQLRIAQDEAQRQGERALTQTNLHNTAAATAARLQAELDQNRSERDVLVAEKDSLRKRIVDMQKQVDDQRQIAVTADLQAKNLVQRVNNLLRQVEELTARNRELEANAPGGGGGGTIGPRSATDEPIKSAPPGVRGKVTGVGATSGMAQINIGSDSGLSPGNNLIVFRGNEYIGDLALTTVEPKVAVGKFTPARRTAKVQEGDSVITSFGGTPQ